MSLTQFTISIFSLVILFLIKSINSSYCGSYIPYGPSSCYEYTNSSSICCYLRGNFEGSYHSMCYPFQRDIYYKMARTVKINGYKFNLDCGHSRGTLCGKVVIPISYKDCSIYSTKSNSCCFYSYTYKNPDDDDYQTETNCIWLGTSDVGEMSYNKLTVICKVANIKVNFMLMLIALFLHFIF